MASLQNMAATPIEITVAGKVYKLAPLSLSQYAALEKWAKKRPFIEVRERIEELGGNVSDAMRDEWNAEAAKISKDKTAIAQAMNSVEGLQRVMRDCLVSGTKGLSDDEIDAVLSAQGMGELNRLVDELTESGVGKKKADPRVGPAPVAPSPKTGL